MLNKSCWTNNPTALNIIPADKRSS